MADQPEAARLSSRHLLGIEHVNDPRIADRGNYLQIIRQTALALLCTAKPLSNLFYENSTRTRVF